MQEASNRRIIEIKNTRFIFRTNFSGDRERDAYGNDERKANLIIPTMEQAHDLLRDGFNVKARTSDPAEAEELGGMGFRVKLTDPRPGHEGDGAVFYVAIKANYNSYYPPKIFLVNDRGEPVELSEDTVNRLDNIRVANVKGIFTPYQKDSQLNRKTLYIKTMYVEQDMDDDPYAAEYAQRRALNNDSGVNQEDLEDEDAPF